MPKYRDIDVDFPAAKVEPNGRKIFSWEALNLSALYDLRDELRASRQAQMEILRVLRRMDRRMAKHMPLK